MWLKNNEFEIVNMYKILCMWVVNVFEDGKCMWTIEAREKSEVDEGYECHFGKFKKFEHAEQELEKIMFRLNSKQ